MSYDVTEIDKAAELVAEKVRVNEIFSRIVANHEKKLASRARIRAAQEGKKVSKRTRARRKVLKELADAAISQG